MNGFEKRTQAKKNQVLEATFNLINTEVGIEKVTMDDIARHANVGKTTIFKYFGSKENLIHEVFKYFITQMRDEARKIMAENKPFEETIIAMSQIKIHFLEKINKQFYLDLMSFFTEKDDDGLSLMMQDHVKESYSLMLDLFHRGRKEGKVDLKYSDEFLLIYFQALVEGISSPHIYSKILPYTAQWTELLIKGVAPSK
ncbi:MULTISPECIES: TetR/AcrR family transcriptional regulator [Paenibacillus]|uniref:TetR family transcriptional regulator n=1 Tax=Paenibacillus campinasensis TaxID=66347 RepID=A0A268ENL5_9BACL|nr:MULTISPECIES: TetR/AcrR family transcriptional regulator [Paenibacillus]PAD74691.1 TetR family transcriptional regulator [Paenibacillus campinasensis]PAK55738.1 TetR family transcriptional regulator [Paenibacillus sp. 7541]